MPLLKNYAKGKFIDLGGGDLYYMNIIKNFVLCYDSIDIGEKNKNQKYTGDLHNISMLGNNTYDSGMILEVLEHVSDPQVVLSEINRILKIGAKLIVSVPHLSRLHEEPYDYYRFINYGLTYLLEKSGFGVITVEPQGALFVFICHQISSILIPLFYRIPLLKTIIFGFNYLCLIRIPILVDELFKFEHRMAAGYICVVEKKDNI